MGWIPMHNLRNRVFTSFIDTHEVSQKNPVSPHSRAISETGFLRVLSIVAKSLKKTRFLDTCAPSQKPGFYEFYRQ